MGGGVGKKVEFQVHGADEVEVHLDVERAAEHGGAWVEDATEEEVLGDSVGWIRWGCGGDEVCAD